MIRLFKEPDDLYEIALVELPENFASLDGDLLLSIVATSSRQGTIANRPSTNLSPFFGPVSAGSSKTPLLGCAHLYADRQNDAYAGPLGVRRRYEGVPPFCRLPSRQYGFRNLARGIYL